MSRYRYEHGQESPVNEPAYRVISLVPSLTESLFDINLGERIIGITDACTRPEDKLAKLPRLGRPPTPDIGRIIALMPDLIFVNPEVQSKEDINTIKEAEIPVWETCPKTVPDVFNLLWNIMYGFDETTMVARVRLLEQSYDWVSGSVRARVEDPPTVFVPLQKNPLTTFTKNTYPGDLMRICGGATLFADAAIADAANADAANDYPEVTIDAVIAAQPAVILLPEPAFTQADVAEYAKLAIPAARNKRIHLVDGDLLTWAGTRIVYALTDIPLLLSPGEKSENEV